MSVSFKQQHGCCRFAAAAAADADVTVSAGLCVHGVASASRSIRRRACASLDDRLAIETPLVFLFHDADSHVSNQTSLKSLTSRRPLCLLTEIIAHTVALHLQAELAVLQLPNNAISIVKFRDSSLLNQISSGGGET